MRGMSKEALEQVENLAMCLIQSAVKNHGGNVPTNDPDFCEAFGVLRGAICTRGPRNTPKIRVAPGSGEPTHADIHAWYRELQNRVLSSRQRLGFPSTNQQINHKEKAK